MVIDVEGSAVAGGWIEPSLLNCNGVMLLMIGSKDDDRSFVDTVDEWQIIGDYNGKA